MDAVNRWPDINAVSQPASERLPALHRPLVQALFTASQHSAILDKIIRFFAPFFNVNGLLGGFLYYIDPTSLEAKRYQFHFGPSNVNPEVLIPDTEAQTVAFTNRSSLVQPIQTVPR